MINTIFHFVNDPTFDYQTAVNNGDISEYTIVFNSADHSIHCKGAMFGRMSRADIADTLGNISDLIPVATDSTLGGIKIGYTNNADLNSRRYGVVLDDNDKAYVEVPWTDTITPEFDDTELKNLIATERGRIDNFISTLSSTIDAKNRELYADGDWVREIFGNVQDPGSVAAAYRKEIDDYLSMFDVWEYIDPEHPELGRKARIVELLNTADGLTHRMGEAETSISGNSVAISTLTHDLSGLTSTVTTISDDLDTVTRKESALEQTVDSIGLRVTASEGDISTLQTQEASLQIQADKIQSRVVATENSINGCYQITIVDNPSNAASAVDVSTISAAVAARTSLSNNQLINDEDFTTAPTAETLYKNNVPQYFTFSRYQGLTVRASSLEQTADSITARVGTVEGSLNDPTTGLITRTSTLEQTASSLSTRVGAVETKATNTETALSSFEQTVNTEISGIKTAHTNLSTNVSSYETTNDGNIGNLIKMAAAVLDLKSSSDAEGNLSTTTDLANVITNGSFTGYSGLSQRVSLTEDGVLANAALISDVQDAIEGLDIDGAVTRATAGFATETWVGQHYDTIGSASTAESNAKGYADNIVAGAKADVIASIDDTVAGMTVLVTKDSNGVIDSGITLKADQVTIDANQTNFKNAVGAFVKTDVLEAGVADIKARLTVGGSDPSGSGTPGTITMKDASDGTIGIWDKDKFAVSTTSSPSSSNSAMLVNADGSGSLSKGNISWNANGDVSVNGTGQFNGVINASSGVFNGVVNATQFKAGSDEGFSITTSPDSLDFNYNGARLAFFSLRGWDSTNNQLADVPDNPTGFYLYLTNPLNGHLITINFAKLSFKDLNENQVLRHGATFYRLSNLNGKAVETPVTLYYSLENNTTKWWLNSDSATELTSSEMGTLYKKQQVSQGGVTYGACAQEVDAGTPYVTTGYTLYELQTLQNNLPTKTGNYAMATHLNTDGSSSTDYWFVVPNSTTLLDSLNTNWSAVFRLSDGRVNSTTATTVIRSSNHNTVPTFNLAVSLISMIDENGNVGSILYPAPSL